MSRICDALAELKLKTMTKQAYAKAKEATLSVLGINNPSLRNHLNNKMQTDEPFVHGPVFEQMLYQNPWDCICIIVHLPTGGRRGIHFTKTIRN